MSRATRCKTGPSSTRRSGGRGASLAVLTAVLFTAIRVGRSTGRQNYGQMYRQTEAISRATGVRAVQPTGPRPKDAVCLRPTVSVWYEVLIVFSSNSTGITQS